jgi:hypothetical protein
MKKFDHDNLKILRRDLNAALAEVALKHGITLELGTMRFSSDSVSCRLTAGTLLSTGTDSKIVGQTNTTPAPMTTALKQGMAIHGIANTTNSKGDQLLDFKPSAPKYCFIYCGPKGGRWRATAEQMRLKFGSVAQAA